MTISFDVLTLAPAVIPMVAALLVLVVDVVLPQRARLPWVVAALGLVGALVPLGLSMRDGVHTRTLCEKGRPTCLWVADHAGQGLQALALGTALVVVLLAMAQQPATAPSLRGRPSVRAMLLLSAAAGCVGVVAARDIASWLVLLELATIPSVALVMLAGGMLAGGRKAAHGALTLLVTALTSFAVLALGLAVWFAATGSAMLDGDAVLHAYADPERKPLIVLAMMLVLAGVGFKLSLAPFHAWTPEAFDGAGAWVAAFLATTSKVGALGGMLVVLRAATSLGGSALVPLAIVAALSMTVGNVMALHQDGTPRLMAWSTVAQAGWVVLPMTAIAPGSVTAAASYLALYAIGTLAVFTVLAALEDGTRRAGRTRTAGALRLDDMRGMFRTHPLLALALALGLLALAGLPPSIIGVVAKVLALRPAVTGGLWWLVVIAALNVMLGVAVYLRWIIVLFAPAPAAPVALAPGSDTVAPRDDDFMLDALPTPTRAYRVIVAIVALAIIAMSLAPTLLLRGF